MKSWLLRISLITIMVLMGFCVVNARAVFNNSSTIPTTAKTGLGDEPYIDVGVHNVGKIGLTITNQGHLGNGFLDNAGSTPSCQYPYPSQQEYLYAGAFWIGAVVGRDTLVSVAADGWSLLREFWPSSSEQEVPLGAAIKRRSLSTDDDAISEQDFTCMYTDTLTDATYVPQDPIDGRPHIPLNIEVTQRSYAWSYEYAEDFVLFDYSIKNIGRRTLNGVYMGIYVDADVPINSVDPNGFSDDICGFYQTRTSINDYGCEVTDTVNIAWIADNNGRNDGGTAAATSCDLPNLTGTRVVRTPSDSLSYSFNWWVSNGTASLDWGPRLAGTPNDPFRDFGGFLGTPEGDKNKYYILRHKEFDYDQIFSDLDLQSEGWLPPGPQASDIADGFDTRYLLSFGPFDIQAGEVLPISFCYVGGEDFHTEPCDQFDDLFSSSDPFPYYDYFNFEDLAKNAVWASWIYDNPGVDTDGDGYFGKFRLCNYIDAGGQPQVDTTFYEGDGVPDFKGAKPPDAPALWVVNESIDPYTGERINDTTGIKFITEIDTTTYEGKIKIRWNGLKSETVRDVFSKELDFEGYKVYISDSPDPEGFSVIASFDNENYNKWVWNSSIQQYQLFDVPFSPESLKCLYAPEGCDDENWDPNDYDRINLFDISGIGPVVDSLGDTTWVNWDSTFYFDRMFYNQGLSDNGIHKRFPDDTFPSATFLNIDYAREHYPETLTDDSMFFRYFEYEYNLDKLLASKLYYIAVTAFDYGAPKSGLESLENPPQQNYIAIYPIDQANKIEEDAATKGLNVIVYPNPYIDYDVENPNSYFNYGEGNDFVTYEGYADSLVSQVSLNHDRVRAVHFINLPHVCTIRIYTLDGDLVRQIDHNTALGSPQSSHDRWDLITRNTQSPSSGIYYYTIESEFGNQIGTLVLIL